MARIVGDGQERHVRAVRRTKDAKTIAIDPVEAGQIVGGGKAVLRVAHAPVIVVEALEGSTVRRRAAEVDRQPGVALVDEVLRVAVPLVAVVRRGPAMRIDDRRHGRILAGAGGAKQEAVDLRAVERAVRDLFRAHVRRVADRQWCRRMQRLHLAGGRDDAELRWRGLVGVLGDDAAVGRPARARPGAAVRDGGDGMRAHIDGDEIEATAAGARGEDRVAVGTPRGTKEIAGVVRELLLVGAVGSDQMQLVPAAALGGEDDPLAVGRPRREAIGHLRRRADRAYGARLDVGDADLALAQVLAHPEDVGNLAPIGRDHGTPLVAVIRTLDRQAARERIGDVDDR